MDKPKINVKPGQVYRLVGEHWDESWRDALVVITGNTYNTMSWWDVTTINGVRGIVSSTELHKYAVEEA